MWELGYKESWVLKNRCFWTVVLEKTLENPMDCQEIKPVYLIHSKSWIFIGRTDAEAEAPILWPLDAKSRLIGKDPKIEGRRRRPWQRMRWLDGITDSMEHNWGTEQYWTEHTAWREAGSSRNAIQDSGLDFLSLHNYPTLSGSLGSPFVAAKPETWGCPFSALPFILHNCTRVWAKHQEGREDEAIGTHLSLLGSPLAEGKSPPWAYDMPAQPTHNCHVPLRLLDRKEKEKTSEEGKDPYISLRCFSSGQMRGFGFKVRYKT